MPSALNLEKAIDKLANQAEETYIIKFTVHELWLLLTH